MNVKKNFTASKVCLTVFASLAGLSLLTTKIANENEGAVNSALKTSSYKKIEVEDGASGTKDTEYYKSDYTKLDDLISDTDKLIEEVEGEGAVLLRNENHALPLAKGSKVSTFGVGSVRATIASTGSISATAATGREVDMKTGLTNAGLQVNGDLWNWYNDNQASYAPTRQGMMVPGPLFTAINEAPFSVVSAANDGNISLYGDAAIFNVVRVSGEGNKDVNRSGCTDTYNGDSLTLSEGEISVLKGLKSLKDAGTVKKIIVLINCTANPDLGFLSDSQYGIDAALQIGSVGTKGFDAIGKILVGDINPSGKLADTMWYSNKENPTLTNQLGYEFLNPDNLQYNIYTDGAGGYEQHYVVYQEGIYLGYRYTESRYFDKVMNKDKVGTFDYATTVAYPFGYGMSYTDFTYSDYNVEKKGDNYVVSVKVTNSGSVAGKDVVEAYLQKPYWDSSYAKANAVEASAVDLVGYTKTKLLAPSESETVTITVAGKDFASYDANGAKTYVLQDGKYYLTIGNGAHDATNNLLAAQGASNTAMVGEGDTSLVKVALDQNKVDTTKYSESVTGKKITNLFDSSDLNKNPFTKEKSPVKYITRGDWNGTVVLDPLNDNSSYTKITMTSEMLADFRSGWDGSMLKEDDIAYPKYGVDNGLMLVDMMKDEDGNEIPYDSDVWDQFMDQLTWDDTVALLSEGMRRTNGLESIAKPETRDHNGPLGVTQKYCEGVNGLAYKNSEDPNAISSTFPCMFMLSGTFNQELVERVGENYGENCLWAGYSGLYGPAMNNHRSQYSSRNAEYYSEDGYLAGKTAAKEVIGLQSKGTYAYIKHFALNDQETNRYGLSTWLNEQSFREIYLKPFQMAIEEGDAHAVMSSYNRVGTRVAAVSSAMCNDWLRGEEGFDGFVVTDMYQLKNYMALTFYLGMVTAPSAVLCGNDLPDGSITAANQFDPYKTGYGELANAMRESAKRILYTVVHSNAMNGTSSTTRFVKVLTSWQIGLIVADVVLCVAAVASLGYFGYVFFVKNIKKKSDAE